MSFSILISADTKKMNNLATKNYGGFSYYCSKSKKK